MNTATENTSDERTEYIAGLRELADLYEANPDLELPYEGRVGAMGVYLSPQNQRERLAVWAKVLPGKKTKRAAGTDGHLYSLSTQLRGVRFAVIADRDEVCERVVVATREVTEEVPDPDALAAVPTVTVTKTVEDVEYVCTSILADRPVELSAVA